MPKTSKNNLDIIIITQGLSRIVNPLMASKHQVVGIIEAASRGYRKRKVSILLRKAYHLVRKFFSEKNPNEFYSFFKGNINKKYTKFLNLKY